LVAMQVAAGRLQLDAPIATYLPEWAAGPNPEWRRNVTLRHLLTHTSGLPPHKPYYETSKGKLGSPQARREVLAKIFSEPLTSEPGKQSSYSDLGFILLGEIVERMTANRWTGWRASASLRRWGCGTRSTTRPRACARAL